MTTSRAPRVLEKEVASVDPGGVGVRTHGPAGPEVESSGGAMRVAQALQLQRTIGNAAVTRLVRGQRKLQRLVLDSVLRSPADRQRIVMYPTIVHPSTIARLDRYFGPSGPGGGVPPHVDVKIDQRIPVTHHDAVRSAVNELAVLGSPNPIVPVDTMVTVAFAGARYRFTHFVRADARTSQDTVVVEQVGPAPAPASTSARSGGVAMPQRAGGPGAVNPRHTTLGPGWSRPDTDALNAALALVPADLIPRNLQFRRTRSIPGGHTGSYDTGHHRLTLANEAFAAQQYGRADQLLETLLHELGHAHDDGSAATRSSAAAFRNAAAADGAAGVSGRTRGGQPAALQGGVTDYANEEWNEYYAEAFALYFADPEGLASLRPNVYDYFETEYARWGQTASGYRALPFWVPPPPAPTPASGRGTGRAAPARPSR